MIIKKNALFVMHLYLYSYYKSNVKCFQHKFPKFNVEFLEDFFTKFVKNNKNCCLFGQIEQFCCWIFIVNKSVRKIYALSI